MKQAGWWGGQAERDAEPHPSRDSVDAHRLVGPASLGVSYRGLDHTSLRDGQAGLGTGCRRLVVAARGGLGARLSGRSRARLVMSAVGAGGEPGLAVSFPGVSCHGEALHPADTQPGHGTQLSSPIPSHVAHVAPFRGFCDTSYGTSTSCRLSI